jgi:hypothetical protein
MRPILTDERLRDLPVGTRVKATVEGVLPGYNAVVIGGDFKDLPQLRILDPGLLGEVVITREGYEVTEVVPVEAL